MKFILYIFYRYYDHGQTKDIAYVKTVLVFLLLLFINIFTILIIFNATEIFNVLKFKSKLLKYIIIGGAYFLPGYLIINYLVSKENLEDERLKLEYKKYHGWFLILYACISVMLLIVAIKLR
jgi:hypothetical protein